jgi:LPS-assembly protein
VHFSLPTITRRLRILTNILAAILTAALSAAASQSGDPNGASDRVRTLIPYRDGIVTLTSDYQDSVQKTRYRARGHVEVTFQDFVISGEEAQYDSESRDGFITGKVRFSQKAQWLTCSRAEFNFSTQTGVFHDAAGYTDQQFSISGRTILKTGKDTYRIEDGLVTACLEKKPKWSFKAGLTNLRVDHTARLHNTTFKIKGVPVFYFPYLVMPLEKKERSSGFVPFHTGNSTSKGRLISEGWYQTLGRSADMLIYGDYFTLRGLAIGGFFRAKPNPQTRFSLQAYGIQDKLNQGGVQLSVDGESQLRDDWRAVAKINITSNFRFRQAFAEDFRSATVPLEKATAFLTRNHFSMSTDIAFEREEVLFPEHSMIVRKLPSLEFHSLGTPLGRTPLTLSFRTSLDGMYRIDSTMKTPQLVQRLDFFPKLTVRLPEFMGFSLIPSLGVRETYYGEQLSEDSANGTTTKGLHRRYTDLGLELRTPVIEGSFSMPGFGKMLHEVEPYAIYRRVAGINDFSRIIRFDEQDAIVNTSEVEYGIVNRFSRNRAAADGRLENQEFLSFGLIQKYYFDPTFGGAFREGGINAFYPLNTVTGFYQTGSSSSRSPVSAIFQLSPRGGIHNDIRLDYDTQHHRWRNESFSIFWWQKDFSLSGSYFKTNVQEGGVHDSNHVTGQIGYGSATRGLSSSLTVSYNLKTSQLLNSNTRVNYMWNCCGVALEFNQYDLGLRTESRLSFSFTLKGIGSFGNLKRPESIF